MRTFKKCLIAGAALVAAAGPALSAPAGKLSWFSQAPFAGVDTGDMPASRVLSPSDHTSFGIDLYSSRRSSLDEAFAPDSAEAPLDIDTVSLYGEFETARPASPGFARLEESGPGRINHVVFGVRWKHRLNAMNSFAVSAEYGEGGAAFPSQLDTLDARAAFSWTSVLPSSVKPSITGSVFLGDEMAREEIYRHLGRKYYGFAIGGSLTLFQSHTPYVSFRMQRSMYDMGEDSLAVMPRISDQSLVSAGWKWQVQRDFSLQAEASYGLGETSTSLDPNSLERSRILFGTRFDFK